MRLSHDHAVREVELFRGGVYRCAPEVCFVPIVAAAREGPSWTSLMVDVSDGLVPAGALTHSSQTGHPLWAPSPVAAELYREVPHEMTTEEIAEIVRAFGDAAGRVREGRLDGVEINAAFGLLVNAFLSPYSNHRTDAYGGSLENRMRFCLEVIRAVRAEAGPDLVVGIRIPGDERVEGGLDLPQMQEISKRLEATGEIDYINVIVGTNLDRFERVRHWPPTPAPHGLFVHLAGAIKLVVGLPVFAVGRVTDARHAENILAAANADMVGMTRAHIADPDLVAKVREGCWADIRPCVGANVCIGNVMEAMPVRCMHNPEAGREAEWGPVAPAARARRVVVIGGGPAGLEAARVAALRGHRVELFESRDALGGALLLWAAVPAMRELRRIVEWQEAQLQPLGVEIHLNREMTPDVVAAARAEAVIIATGAHPRISPLPGAADATIRVVTPHAVLAGRVAPVRRAVLWDEAGGQIGLSAAEWLANAGTIVEIITPGFAIGEDVTLTVRIPLYERLLSSGASFIPNSRVLRIEGSDVVAHNLYSGEESRMPDVDVLVAWSGSRVNDDLWRSLRGRVPELYAVGDCVAPRSVESAMAEGAKVARAL